MRARRAMASYSQQGQRADTPVIRGRVRAWALEKLSGERISSITMTAHEPEFDLASISDFAAAVGGARGDAFDAIGMHCVRCGGLRRMRVKRVAGVPAVVGGRAVFELPETTPALFSLTCVHCKLKHDALVHVGPDGPELAIFSSERGGFSTPNTPKNITYYLDQAHRAESVGATSAAVAMYRSAVEMILFDQGYTVRMLNPKIEALEADASPPPWRDRIDSDYLEVIKKLGNAATHPNDGDVEKQKALDRELLLQVRMTFEELLQVIYERPVQEAARKAKLRAVAVSITDPRPGEKVAGGS